MNIRTNMKLSIGSFMALAMGLLGVLSSNQAQAQAKIGTNPGTINDRSVLELESNNQALYLPRLTTQELGNVSGWQEGMVVYNTTVACIQVFDGSNWECVGSDLNGIYSGSGSLSGATTVTMAGNDLNFTSTGGEVSIASTFNNHLDIGGTNNAGGIRIDRGTDGLKTGYIGYAEADNGDTMIVSNATGGGTLFLTGTGRTIIGKATTYPTTTATGAVTQFVVNHSNGQVGIGTDAPSQRLEVNGRIRVGNDALATPTHYDLPSARGSNGQILQTDGSGNVTWVTPTSTNTDAQDLTLTGNTLAVTNDATTVDISTATAVVANTATTTLIGNGAAGQYLDGDGTWKTLPSGADGISSAAALSLTGGTTLQLTDGTNTTTQDLAGILDGNGIYSGSGSLSGATTVTMAGNDLNFTSTGGEVSIASTFNNHLDIGGTNNAGGIRIDRGTDGLKTGYIGYAEADNGDTMIVSNATGGGTLFLTGTGRTIIGKATTYPTTTATGAVTQFVVNHSNGQVGIGVAAPESRLHLRGSNATGAANGGYLTIEANAAVNLEFLTSGGGQDQSILYNVAGTQQASIDYDVSEDNLLFTGFNRIGLGTITPNATLDVNGSVAHNITTSTTIGADAHFVILAGGAVTLPTGTTQTGRVLTFINTHATNAITFTTAPTGSITQVNAGMSASAIYDGTTWYWYSIN